ncbi:MAG: hypothetical protein HYS12_00800 [Planctomycetes bacterium]|nr:hypothetical protein [Planctomycetota bacterium]
MEPNLSLAYVLIGAGFLLMVAELFIPSGGVLSVLSACGILAGIVMAFFHNTETGLWTLLAVCVALPVVGGLALHYWPKTPMGRRFFLTAPDEHATMASLPENLEMEGLRGQFGQALSSLRPAGVVDFNGRRIDCMTEGLMVERGQWVRCVDVKSGKVIVRPVEKPNLNDLEAADFG